MTIQTATLGYPRIGRNREVKKALEAFWSGKSDAETLLQIVRNVESMNWSTQLEAGIDRIGIGDTTLYDHVLDWTLRQIWVNPDCGLKTRRWEEVIPALKNMVAATKMLREEANETGR